MTPTHEQWEAAARKIVGFSFYGHENDDSRTFSGNMGTVTKEQALAGDFKAAGPLEFRNVVPAQPPSMTDYPYGNQRPTQAQIQAARDAICAYTRTNSLYTAKDLALFILDAVWKVS